MIYDVHISFPKLKVASRVQTYDVNKNSSNKTIGSAHAIARRTFIYP